MSCKRGHTLTHSSLFRVKQIRFYALPLTSPIFESPRSHTQNFTPPPPTQPPPLQHLHTPSLYQTNVWSYHILSIPLLSKKAKKGS